MTENTNDIHKQSIIKVVLNKVLTFFQGLLMGIANVIPGVSGGTILLVLGVYSRFIDFLSAVSKVVTALFRRIFIHTDESKAVLKDHFRSVDWLWGVLLFLGRGIAVLIAAGFMIFFLEVYPAQTYGLFFGLILASIIVPISKMERKGVFELLGFVIAFGLLFWFSGVEVSSGTESAPALWLLLIAGYIATSAMVLPGISGSFLLLMMGVHTFIFSRASLILQGELFTFAVAVPLILYGIGWVGGILSFPRVLNYFLKKHHSVTMAVLGGLMLGSLRRIYPFLDTAQNTEGMKADRIPKLLFWDMPDNTPLADYLNSCEFISILCCIVSGITIVLAIHFIGKHFDAKKNK